MDIFSIRTFVDIISPLVTRRKQRNMLAHQVMIEVHLQVGQQA
jgi:hypothetical protein